MNIYKCIGCDHGPCFHRSEPDGCRFGCTTEKWVMISSGARKEGRVKTKKLIEQLERYQRWRKGGDIPQPEPFEVTEMIDAAIVALRGIRDLEK